MSAGYVTPMFRRFAPVGSSSPTGTAAVVVGDPRSGTPPTSLTAPSTHSKGKVMSELEEAALAYVEARDAIYATSTDTVTDRAYAAYDAAYARFLAAARAHPAVRL